MTSFESTHSAMRNMDRMPPLRRPGRLLQIGSGDSRLRLLIFWLCCTAQFVHVDAVNAAPHYRVGACLSARDMPPPKKGETEIQYYWRAIKELEHIADALKEGTPNDTMEVDYVLLSAAPNVPKPTGCTKSNPRKHDYDIWLTLIYEENSTFVYEVSHWEGKDLKLLENNPEPFPDNKKTRELLADLGRRIVATTTASEPVPIPIDKIHNTSKGIIFVYDSSSSTYETDPQAWNRLGVASTIGDILLHTTQAEAQPIPFAMVVFSDDAEILENTNGSKWFDITSNDLATARSRLALALKRKGLTNISSAFKEVANLIDSRKDIEHWHVIFFTDGVPTVGITNYAELTKVVNEALGGRGLLSVIALHGNDPSHTEDVKLAQLVHATLDGLGQAGEIINLKVGDDLKRFENSLQRIAFLVNQFTIRDQVDLKCIYDSSAEREDCELDKNQPHALRFGAAHNVIFIANATALYGGKAIAKIGNEGLGNAPLTIELAEGQLSTTVATDAFKITLSRSKERIFLTIEMLTGRVNGDWQISLTVTGRLAPP